MAAPLALLAGSLLKGAGTAAAKTALAGGTKAAIGASAKGAIKSTIKKTALSAVKNKFGKKKISKDKLLGKPEGSLVKTDSNSTSYKRPSSIIKSGSSSLSKGLKPAEEDTSKTEVKSPFGSIIEELTNIQNSLESIQSSINSEIALIKNRLELNKKELFKEKAEEKESRLEKKDDKEDDDEKEQEEKKPLSLFDKMWNFLSNVLAGSLLNWALNYLPLVTDAFQSVIDAFSNPLKLIRFTIISLTTNFPRLLRKVLSFSKNIFSGPAKFVGKLIIKAATSIKKVFKKAGKFIFDLIKNPLKDVAKRILGESGRNIAKTSLQKTGQFIGGNAPKILKRLKTFSKVFKRVPIIGALIGMGIDLAMGESLDRAVIGAIGSSIGAAIGGAIGTGVIPIPIVGTAVGGIVGSAIGDWAAKKFYENLRGKVSEAEQESNIDDTPVQSISKGGAVKNNRKQVTRETTIQKREFIEKKTQKIPSYQKSPKIEKSVINHSKENVLQGENSANRFVRISDAFRSMPLVGEVMNLGIAIGMGKKITNQDSTHAANQIANSIGISIRDSKIKGIDPDMAESISGSLSQWAKREILFELNSRKNLFTIRETDKDKGGAGRGPGTGAAGGGGDLETAGEAVAASELYKRIGADSDQWDIYRNSVALIESGGRYSAMGGSGKHYDGRYQMGEAAKKDGSKIAGVSYPGHSSDPNAHVRVSFRNNPQLQETIFTGFTIANHNYLMRNSKYASASVERKLQILGYAHNQGMGGAEIWLNTGQVGADGFGTKGTKYTDLIAKNFRAKKSGRGMQLASGSISVPAEVGEMRSQSLKVETASHSPHPQTGSRGSRSSGSRKQIVFHWNAAGGYNDTAGPYHSVFKGDGTKVQKSNYGSKTPGTLYRPNAINLAVAANPDTGQWPKSVQLNAMAQEAANIAKSWGWTSSSINARTIPGHGEVGAGKDLGNLSQNISTGRSPSKGPAGSQDNYGPTIWGGDGSRWDLSRLTSSQKIGDGEKAFRNMIIQKMSGATSTTNINDASDTDTDMDSSDSPDTSSQSQQAPLDPSLFFDVKGERSNKSNVSIEKVPEGGDKASAGRKGGGDIPIKINQSKILSSSNSNKPKKSLNISNATSNDNNNASNYLSHNKSITKVTDFNVNPLYFSASYESTNSTIIMMQLPQQNNTQPEIQMPSNTKIIPLLNKSTDVYKQVLTKALY